MVKGLNSISSSEYIFQPHPKDIPDYMLVWTTVSSLTVASLPDSPKIAALALFCVGLCRKYIKHPIPHYFFTGVCATSLLYYMLAFNAILTIQSFGYGTILVISAWLFGRDSSWKQLGIILENLLFATFYVFIIRKNILN
jgi:hypothetical protein